MLLTIIVPVYNQETLVITALDSIPKRDDIEVLIVDDGSTDNTLKNVRKYKSDHPEMNIRIIHNKINHGLGHAKNVGYANARGDYINQLDSDDFLYTEEYEKAMAQLDGTDMVYISLRINSGAVWQLRKENNYLFCGGTLRFIRREFLGDSRCPEVRAGEDWFLNDELQRKPHTDKYTGIVAYHYNFPREGSLCDLRNRGLL